MFLVGFEGLRVNWLGTLSGYDRLRSGPVSVILQLTNLTYKLL